MTVYADVLVIVNLYIDFFLLWCVKKALGLSAKRRRLALGALLGGIVQRRGVNAVPAGSSRWGRCSPCPAGPLCCWAFSPRWG